MHNLRTKDILAVTFDTHAHTHKKVQLHHQQHNVVLLVIFMLLCIVLHSLCPCYYLLDIVLYAHKTATIVHWSVEDRRAKSVWTWKSNGTYEALNTLDGPDSDSQQFTTTKRFGKLYLNPYIWNVAISCVCCFVRLLLQWKFIWLMQTCLLLWARGWKE